MMTEGLMMAVAIATTATQYSAAAFSFKPPVHSPLSISSLPSITRNNAHHHQYPIHHRRQDNSKSSSSSLNAILDDKENKTFFLEEKEKEWSVKPPNAKDSFQRARLAEQLRLSKSTNGFKAPSAATTSSSSNLLPPSYSIDLSFLTNILQSMLNPEIEKGVPSRTILGSAVGGTVLSFLTCTLLGLPLRTSTVAALSLGIIASYISITKGSAGDTVRTVGETTSDAAEATIDSIEALLGEYYEKQKEREQLRLEAAARAKRAMEEVKLAKAQAEAEESWRLEKEEKAR
eukprot:scaffold21414_cov32-Cyclotella_meneghiniana.AAC.1